MTENFSRSQKLAELLEKFLQNQNQTSLNLVLYSSEAKKIRRDYEMLIVSRDPNVSLLQPQPHHYLIEKR